MTPEAALSEELKTAFCRLVDDRPELSSGVERSQWLVDCNQLLNQAHALYLGVLADFDRNRDFDLSGSLGSVAWLGWKLRLNPYDAKRQVCTARRLRDCERTEDALAQGEISLDQAVRITQTMEQIGGNEVAARFADENGELPTPPEEILVESARRELPRQFRHACETMKFYLRPEQALAESNAELEREYLCFSQTWEGRFVLNGEYAAENGARIMTMLDALMRPASKEDPRGAPERRAAALAEAADRLLTAGEVPAAGGERPHLALVTDLANLREEPDGMVAFLDRTGQPVPGKLAQKIACDCWVTPIVVDQKGQVLNVGRRSRTFTPHQRKAIAQRDGGCGWPGCDARPGWCDGHHLVPWWLGGSTDLDNGVLLCRAHHTKVHQLGWTLTRDPVPGTFEVKPP